MASSSAPLAREVTSPAKYPTPLVQGAAVRSTEGESDHWRQSVYAPRLQDYGVPRARRRLSIAVSPPTICRALVVESAGMRLPRCEPSGTGQRFGTDERAIAAPSVAELALLTATEAPHPPRAMTHAGESTSSGHLDGVVHVLDESRGSAAVPVVTQLSAPVLSPTRKLTIA